MSPIEPLLLSTTKILTFSGQDNLTNASGFFFERDDHLYLVSSRHVMFDQPSNHIPDRIELEIHVNKHNMAESTGFSVLLYRNEKSVWRQATDSAGEIDVAVIELDKSALPETMVYSAFTPAHLLKPDTNVDVGTQLLVVGYPLGFHDTLHHIPVVRTGSLASSFGLRFQGSGFFLTDARTHRGISGAPVVMRTVSQNPILGELQCYLLGIHSARLDLVTMLFIGNSFYFSCT